jgi:YSIRK-targeted surface antigen transcriptional regulator
METDTQIILGPIVSTPLSKKILSGILAESSVSSTHTELVWDFFQCSPTFSLSQFFSILALIHYEINQEEIVPTQYFFQSENAVTDPIQTQHSSKLFEAKEKEMFHNTYHFEQEFYGYVESGNTTALKSLFEYQRNLREGTVADNTLRQAKNIFISSITLVTRHSIAGGLDIETAYQLSDVYIQEMEKMQDIISINQLQMTAAFDFTNRVAENKIPSDMSADIYESLQYISTHTNQPIRVEDVAAHIGKSRSYLSRKFKAELGFQISDFIMRRKLEEAKSLLSFTDKSISEISEYLCFSSQSYFQNVFKKKYGITPNQYRRKK